MPLSHVWQFYKNLGGEAAECNTCKVAIKRKNNTTNLIAHLRKHHAQYDAYCKLAAGKKNKETDSQSEDDDCTMRGGGGMQQGGSKGKSAKQTKLTYFTNPPLTKTRQEDITSALVDWLCGDSVPIYAIEKDGFRKFMSVIEKRYEVPSRKTAMARITSNYNVKCKLLRSELDKHIVQPGKFCSITTDMWSASTMEPYMAVTIHYINNDWELQSRLLQCSYLPGSHTGELLAEEIAESMVEWGLAKSAHISDTLGASLPHLSAVTSDNGSNIVKACSVLGCGRIPCFGHCLNLAVKKGLEDERIVRALTAVRKVVRHFAHSGQKQQQLTKVQDELGAPNKKLKNDCDTRYVQDLKLYWSV